MALADLPPDTHADQVRNHWWSRPGWTPTSQFYTWHITFENAPQLHQLAARYQQALGRFPGLAFVPARWLHLTMQGVGFVDQVPGSKLDAIINEVRRKLCDLSPFDLRFGPAIVSTEAICMPAENPEPITHLRQLIRDTVGDAYPGETIPDSPRFRPHVSVAYINDDGPARPYIDAVDRTRPDPITVPIRHASLIALRRHDRQYQWTTHTEVPIGTTTSA